MTAERPVVDVIVHVVIDSVVTYLAVTGRERMDSESEIVGIGSIEMTGPVVRDVVPLAGRYPLNIMVVDTEVIVTGSGIASAVRASIGSDILGRSVLHVIGDGGETTPGDIGVRPYGSVVA